MDTNCGIELGGDRRGLLVQTFDLGNLFFFDHLTHALGIVHFKAACSKRIIFVFISSPEPQ